MRGRSGRRTPTRAGAIQRIATGLLAGLLAAGCGVVTTDTGGAAPRRTETSSRAESRQAQLDPAQVERLRRLLPPLVQAMDNKIPLSEVRLGVIDAPEINAASAGKGRFYVTTGLLQKADDRRLLGVLAHEVAHDDLGHVAEAQTRAGAIGLGVVILDALIPGSAAVTPIAGELINRRYSRRDELEADRHAVELLRRIGQPREVLLDTLTWLRATSGPGGGGFFSTHPGTEERIEQIRRLSAR